jgi:hydrocephalus-inducing protein
MLFAGKKIEMTFEYLPDDAITAESFFKFKLVNLGLEQLFLFVGHVIEPKVFFSNSKINFHSMILGGEGKCWG